jgi:hypothetical protein
MCAISNSPPAVVREDDPHMSLVAAHVFPVCQLSEWNHGYKRFANDTGSATEIGKSRLYSSQNGLLLTGDMHTLFDNYFVGVDPDVRSLTFPLFYPYL